MGRSNDLIVVGAGLAGLTAAWHCQRAGKRVLVLEGRDRVGGRTLTWETTYRGRPSHFDFGAQFVGHEKWQADLWDLALDLGLTPFAQYEGPDTDTKQDRLPDPFWEGEGANLRLCSGTGQIEAYIGSTIPPTDGGVYFLMYLESLVESVHLEAPELTPDAPALDAMSVWQWVNELDMPGCGKATTAFKALCRMLCRVSFAAEPEEVSMLWLLFYIRSSGGLRRFQALRWPMQGTQGHRLLGGAQSIAEKLAEALRKVDPDCIVTGAEVRAVTDDGTSVAIKTCADDGAVAVHHAKKCLMAMAPSVLDRISFVPARPQHAKIASAMPDAHMIMTVVTFRSAFWRGDTTTYLCGKANGIPVKNISRFGLSGDVLAADDDVVLIMDSTSGAGQPALSAVVSGQAARAWSARTREDRQSQVLLRMKNAFGEKAIREFVAYKEYDWGRDDYARGCPAGHVRPGGFLSNMDKILLSKTAPVGNIFTASAETALVSNGHMSGAVWSGKVVARRILEALGETSSDGSVPEARALSMRNCIDQVISAIQLLNPIPELTAITQDCSFVAPGGRALPNDPANPYVGWHGAVAFHARLADVFTITRFEAERISVDVEDNTAWADVRMSGVSNISGLPFQTVPGTMWFRFNDPSEPRALIAEEMLAMDSALIDEIAFGARSPERSSVCPRAFAEIAMSDTRALLEKGTIPDGTSAAVVTYGPGGPVTPTGPHLGPDGLASVLRDLRKAVSTTTWEGGYLDEETLTIHMRAKIRGHGAQSGAPFNQPMLLVANILNGPEPEIESYRFLTDTVALI